jgi:hypothetical protein
MGAVRGPAVSMRQGVGGHFGRRIARDEIDAVLA